MLLHGFFKESAADIKLDSVPRGTHATSRVPGPRAEVGSELADSNFETPISY